MSKEAGASGVIRLSIRMSTLAAVWCTIAFPIAATMAHGTNPSIWPSAATQPTTWLWYFQSLRFGEIFDTYVRMFEGRSPAFPDGGRSTFWVLAATYLATVVLLLPWSSSSNDGRDRTGQLGAARWANGRERARMRNGLELGHDPETNRPIRVSVEGNMLSIAPPRTGKTSGLIINNLLAPDNSSWAGPAVVIDPKGEVYRAVAKRRKALGRCVIRFDLRKGVKNGDRWNPIGSLQPNDAERLQNIARALIADVGNDNPYFAVRGISLFAGAIAAAILEAGRFGRRASPADVGRLLSDPAALLDLARSGEGQIFQSLVGDLLLDERARDQLLSTAKMGVAWLLDERFQHLTSDSTFSMEQVARGEADLFIIVPPESAELLAPLVRWLFIDLFSAIDGARRPDDERVVLFIDEADSLGRFDELRKALGLLPGRGVSIWTFWQSRSQIEERYGEHGAAVFADTAEVVTMSDIGRLGREAEHVSKALDNFTALIESTSTQLSAGNQSSGISQAKHAVPLMTTDALKVMSTDDLIVLLNSRRYGKHPLQLKKVRYFEERRFAGLHNAIPPAAKL